MTSLLIVEDDDAYRSALCRTLAPQHFDITAVATVNEARAALLLAAPDLALVDLKLPDGSGLAVVLALAASAPACRTLVLSGQGTIPDAVEALRLGAVDFLTKPIGGAELLAALQDALEPLPAESLEQVERRHILAVLQACGGNVTEAARRLGLYRRTLQRKLQKLPKHR